MKITAAESRRAIQAIHLAIQKRRRDRFVFIGGGLVPLLITDPAASPARPTKDVDVVFSVATLGEYSYIRQDLLNSGFEDDITLDKPACALFFQGWRVDFLCSSPGIIDAGNRWFEAVLQDPVEHDLDGVPIWRASTPSWIATKLEAWRNRGRLSNGAPDYYHQDIEDIIAVVDGRPECIEEIADSIEAVGRFLTETISLLLASEDFLSALPGHTGGHERAKVVLKRFEAILDQRQAYP